MIIITSLRITVDLLYFKTSGLRSSEPTASKRFTNKFDLYISYSVADWWYLKSYIGSSWVRIIQMRVSETLLWNIIPIVPKMWRYQKLDISLIC